MPRPERISSAERARLSPKERARRKKVGDQKMALRVEGTDLYKLVKRIKVTISDLNAEFGCDAWYIKDEGSGDVIWPERWQQDMQPSTEQNPWRYMIVNRDHFPRFDQGRSQTHFDGDQVIWLENVPYECEAASLVCWLRAGLEITLPHIRIAAAKAEVLKGKFEDANAEMSECAKQEPRDEEEAHYKALRLESLTATMDRAEQRFLRQQELHKALIQVRQAHQVVAEAALSGEEEGAGAAWAAALWSLVEPSMRSTCLLCRLWGVSSILTLSAPRPAGHQRRALGGRARGAGAIPGQGSMAAHLRPQGPRGVHHAQRKKAPRLHAQSF